MALNTVAVAKKKVAFWLLLPFLPYIIPVILGLAWLPVGDISESITGSNYPYGFTGRAPAITPTPDPKTSTQYNIPYFFQLKNFINEGELPLWNPNAGLGMPFAALGEGSPYSPLSMLRAFVPPHFHDIISIAGFMLASLFFYMFLRELGFREGHALLSTSIYSLQGAFASTILLPNISQSIIFFPVVFWSCMRVVNKRRHSLPVFALSIFLLMTSGHIQHSFIGAFALMTFAFAYSLITKKGSNVMGRLILGFSLGLMLSAPYLLPIYAYIKSGVHHHPQGLGLITNTFASINYMLDPFQFGGFRGAVKLGDELIFKPNENLLYLGMVFFFLATASVVGVWKRFKENAGVVICFFIGFFILLKESLIYSSVALW